MAQVSTPVTIQNVQSFEDLRRFVKKALTDIINQINGNIQFVSNIAAAGPYQLTFTAANAPVSLAHVLGVVPSGFIVINTTAAMSIYKAPGNGNGIDWTQTSIVLQSDRVGTATLYLI
jgi:hypothetical protein